MLLAFTTNLDCRRPAFWLERAVTFAAVLPAGLEPADHHVGATIDPAFTWTTAVLATETFAMRGGGAARHGARLLVSTAVNEAMWRSSTLCVGGAALRLAFALCTMLAADTTCCSKSGAAFRLAHFLVAVTAVLPAVSFFDRYSSSDAVAERAEPVSAMWHAESTSFSSCTTTIS